MTQYSDKNSTEGNSKRCSKWKRTHRKDYNAYMREYMRKRRNAKRSRDIS